MRDRKKFSASIYFTQKEYGILEKAKQYSVLPESTLLRVLIKEYIINIYKEKTEINLYFCVSGSGCVHDESIFKTRIIYFAEEDFSVIDRLIASTRMTPSNFIKYHIMPELKKIIKEKGGSGKV